MSSSGEVGTVKRLKWNNFLENKRKQEISFIHLLTVCAHDKYFRSLDVTLCAYKAEGAVTQTYCFWVIEGHNPYSYLDTTGKQPI